MDKKKVYINTIGCQMNVYDSGRMLKLLAPLKYISIPFIEDADLIIVNTCAIREKAVHKLYSFLGRLYRFKNANKDLIIVVSGCVAQQQGEKLMERFPNVDIVMGTHAVHRLPDLLHGVENHRHGLVDIEVSDEIHEIDPFKAPCLRSSDVTGSVTIMRGCDNYCTYCVVPYVRGREVSRRPEAVLSEIRALVRSGVKEVTLLGQNVNSYGMKEGLTPFPELIEQVNRVEGLERIRFVTSHPKDLSDRLIRSFATIDKLCNHIHLPVQSGSDRILKRMNRKYTSRMYIEKVGKLREASPEIAITTDMIVGFPGETEDDYRKTLELMKTVRFDGGYAFEYSDRPDAPASHFTDKIKQQIKNNRLRELLDLQGMMTREKNKSLIGRVFPVLIEGGSKKQLKQQPALSASLLELTGRTPENRIVNFYRPSDCGLDIEDLKGQIIKVRIDKGYANSLWGTPTDSRLGCPGVKGGDYHVA
jgi:tRNA-2-methylthio-N6-dimethylallyladenosine synthase